MNSGKFFVNLALKVIFLSVLAFGFARSSGAFADERGIVCDCGCGIRGCTCTYGNGYRFGETPRTEWVMAAEGYDDLSNDNGTILYGERGVTITPIKTNHSWTYYMGIPSAGLNRLNWSAGLEVREHTGNIAYGLTMSNQEIGIGFSVNQFGKVELRYIHSNVTALTVNTFYVKDTPILKKMPQNLILNYDIPSGRLTGFIDATRVFDITLPYYGIPAIGSVSQVAIETVTPDDRRPTGSVTFGDLVIEGE